MSGGALNVVVCGSGGDAHALAGLTAALTDVTTSVLLLKADEATRWSEAMGRNGITVMKYDAESNRIEVKGKVRQVTSDAKDCVPAANVIILAVSAWDQEAYLQAIEPHVEPNCMIVGFPGNVGFHLLTAKLLKSKGKKCAVLSLNAEPWACRIKEFGTRVQILGEKEEVAVSMVLGRSELPGEPLKILQRLLGEPPTLYLTTNYLEPYLANMSYINPVIMYSKWSEWDGKPVSEKPYFFAGLEAAAAELLTKVGEEVQATARALEDKSHGRLDMSRVKPLFQAYKDEYEDCIEDDSSLLKAMQTNTACRILRHPMCALEEEGYEPNFEYSYLTEDVPVNLVAVRGLAALVSVRTPSLDKVLTWSQEKLGKEFLVGSDLTGKDLESARAPQSFGFTKLDDLLALLPARS